MNYKVFHIQRCSKKKKCYNKRRSENRTNLQWNSFLGKIADIDLQIYRILQKFSNQICHKTPLKSWDL